MPNGSCESSCRYRVDAFDENERNKILSLAVRRKFPYLFDLFHLIISLMQVEIGPGSKSDLYFWI